MRKHEEGRKSAKRRHSSILSPALFLGIVVVVLVALILVPTSGRSRKSGITLYGENPDAAIYGPTLPKETPEAVPVPLPDEVLLPDRDEEEVLYVYASDGQECYHLSTCKFAYASGHRFTVSEAQMLGYKPCGRCNPPTVW